MKTLLDLLPVSPNAMLKTPEEKVKFLNMYVYFVKLAIESFEAFLQGDLQKFDAHVGDTACQIRAYRVYKLYHFTSTRERLPPVILTFQKMLDVLGEIITEVSKLRQKSYISNKDFLDLLKIEMPLDADLVFLIVTFFLTKYTFIDDEVRIIGRIEAEKMQSDLHSAAKSSVKRLIIKLQRILAEDSYDFLEKLTVSNQELHCASVLLVNTLLFDDVERAVVPGFLSNYIIFTDCLCCAAKILIVCKIAGENYINLIFQASSASRVFELVEESEPDGPYIAIKGEALALHSRDEVIHCIEKTGGFLQLFLATVALHPQFSGKKFIAYNQDFFKFLFDKSSGFLIAEDIAWFTDLYANMLNLGKELFEIEQGHYFLARHVYSTQG